MFSFLLTLKYAVQQSKEAEGNLYDEALKEKDNVLESYSSLKDEKSKSNFKKTKRQEESKQEHQLKNEHSKRARRDKTQRKHVFGVITALSPILYWKGKPPQFLVEIATLHSADEIAHTKVEQVLHCLPKEIEKIGYFVRLVSLLIFTGNTPLQDLHSYTFQW